MIDIITIVGIWLVSLVFAFVSVRQAKGVDWYAPISNKQKMIMTLINVSIVLLVMIFIFAIIQGILWKIVVVSGVCIIIILYFSYPQLLDPIRNKLAKSKKEENTSNYLILNDNDNDNNNSNHDKNTLLDIFSRILTVFNSMFFLTNILYVLYTYENIKNDSNSVFEAIFINNSVFPVHATILFWTTMSAIVITKKGWEYHKEVEQTSEEKKRKKYYAHFFAKRITDRNK